MPLLKAKQGLNRIEVGQTVKLIATDPGSERDFHAFAKLSEHSLTYFEKTDTELTYVLKKGEK